MPSLEVSVDGDEDIAHALLVFGAKVEKQILTKAFRRGAAVIQKAARSNLAMLHETGELSTPLARGLKVGVLTRKRKRGTPVGIRIYTPTKAALGIPQGSRWYAPAHLELGTKRSAARPYMRAAFDDNQKGIFNEVVTTINREIGKITG